MFRSLAIALALLLGSLSATAGETLPDQTVILDIPGMTCSFCPITIRKALQKVDGVIAASADYDSKTATVRFDPARTNVSELIRATAEAGYPSTARQ